MSYRLLNRAAPSQRQTQDAVGPTGRIRLRGQAFGDGLLSHEVPVSQVKDMLPTNAEMPQRLLTTISLALTRL
jgi:hypothetical protein